MTDYKLMPKQITKEMADAFWEEYSKDRDDDLLMRCYKALYATSPAPQPVEQQSAPNEQMVVVGWQFYQDGKWWSGDDRIKDHRKNTVAAGIPVRDVYTAPQSAEQTSINPNLASDAAKHLTDWLEMGLCECGGVHSCGYYEVKRTRDALLVAAEQQECGCCGQTVTCDGDCDSAEQHPDVAQLVEAMRMLAVAGNRLNDEAEECTYDDGVAEVASVDFWGDFREALEAADAALSACRKQETTNDKLYK